VSRSVSLASVGPRSAPGPTPGCRPAAAAARPAGSGWASRRERLRCSRGSPVLTGRSAARQDGGAPPPFQPRGVQSTLAPARVGRPRHLVTGGRRRHGARSGCHVLGWRGHGRAGGERPATDRAPGRGYGPAVRAGAPRPRHVWCEPGQGHARQGWAPARGPAHRPRWAAPRATDARAGRPLSIAHAPSRRGFSRQRSRHRGAATGPPPRWPHRIERRRR
jgi:hypothetical protein